MLLLADANAQIPDVPSSYCGARGATGPKCDDFHMHFVKFIIDCKLSLPGTFEEFLHPVVETGTFCPTTGHRLVRIDYIAVGDTFRCVKHSYQTIHDFTIGHVKLDHAPIVFSAQCRSVSTQRLSMLYRGGFQDMKS